MADGPPHRAPTKAFYVTTPIYYVNDAPHIGHAYTTVAGDMSPAGTASAARTSGSSPAPTSTARRCMRTAEADGVSPQEWTDRLVENEWKPCSRRIDVANDDFIRTTERGTERVQEFWQTLYDDGRGLRGRLRGALLRGQRGVQAARRAARRRRRRRRQKVCPIHGRPVEIIIGEELLLPAVRLRRPAARALRGQPRRSSSPSRARNEVVSFVQARPAGPVDLAVHLRLGHPGAVGRHARPLRLDRRAAQLRRRPPATATEPGERFAHDSGRPTSTSSARTSCASTR